MMRVPPDRSLRAFEAVARLGSMAAAAEELGLTLSAVSHRIRALESHVNAKLFKRRHRGLELSPTGRQLFQALSGPYHAIDVALAKTRQGSGRRVLNVYCAPSFAAKWLSPRLPKFVRACPEVDLQLIAKPATDVLPPETDVAIFYGQSSIPGMISRPLPRERIAPYGPPALLERLAPRSPRDLLQAPRIESINNIGTWSRWFAANDVFDAPGEAALKFDRSFMAISASVDGLGIILESHLFVEREVAKGELQPVLAGSRPVEISAHGIGIAARTVVPTEAQLFRDWIYSEIMAAETAS